MDEIRRQVMDRISELGLNARRVSLKLGKHPGYMHEWINGKQQSLPYEVKLMLAKELDIDVRSFGAAPIGDHAPRPTGFAQDASVYEPPPGHMLARLPHIAYFQVKSRSLDQHEKRIVPGKIVAFNINRTDPAQIDSGAVVIVQCYSKTDLTTSKGTIMRQFVSPNKLITNSSEFNEIISMDDQSLDFEPVIKGTMTGVFDELS